jgi:hypothetical protein
MPSPNDVILHRALQVNAQLVRSHELAEWLVSLDDPANAAERRTVTLSHIIDRARTALASR